ncbi:hypothetical protein D1007_16988 [Hordeum vulgare]|uniref:uncharacterized protein LOC123450890 n=1 Tax=Hordeum vulgare subsp. vulgare TaxID=112509 RepID=UPI000B46441F|nr:uncharacterized protein LOC123450890 [Hordeum vulgare subsp. vulgare]KAE8806894.1 hypothetical protein D1007_16988 [Hordeum vulgare]
MSSCNLLVALNSIRKHIDYDFCDVHGGIIKRNKSTLVAFLSRINKNELAPVSGEKIPTICPLLSEDMIQLLIGLLQIFKDMFRANICLRNFDENHIVIVDGHIPKIIQNALFVESTEGYMNQNVMCLGQVIENVVFANCQLLAESKDFVNLFKDGTKNFDLIIVHPTLVHICFKIDYFGNTHDFLLKFIKKLDNAAYTDIINDLDFPADWETLIDSNDHLIKCYSNRQVGRGKSRAAPSQSGTTIVHPQTPAVSSSGTPHAQGVSNSGRNPPQTNPAPLSCQHSKNNRGCTQPMFREKLSCQQVQSSAGAGMPSSNSTRAPMSKDPPVKNKAPMAASVGGKQGQPSNKGKAPLTSSSTTTLLSKQRQPNVCQDSSSSKPSKPSLKMKKKKKKYNLPGTKSPEEVMKYYRNSGRHGVDESVKDQQLQFGVKALNIILLFYFQKLLCSALRGIHRKNYLSRMETLPRVLR